MAGREPERGETSDIVAANVTRLRRAMGSTTASCLSVSRRQRTGRSRPWACGGSRRETAGSPWTT